MISIHFVVDNADPKHLDRGLLYLKRTKQRRTNIAAGSQLDRGMQFVERVKAELPSIEVTWRNLDPEDTGISSTMTAQECYNHKVKRFLTWFKKHNLVFMPDNESSGDDNRIRAYAQWQADFGKLLHADGLRGAFGRFSTGNIREHQYALLQPIFNMMLTGDYISPNEYSNAPGKSSGGHLERYKHLWAAAGRILPTTIGEAGIAVDYDPGKGWLAVPGLSGAAYAQQMIDEEVWYKNGAIDRFLYCIGGHTWPLFQLVQSLHNGEAQSDTLDYLENYYARQGMPPDLTPEQPPTPPPPAPTPPPPPPAEVKPTPDQLRYPALVTAFGITEAFLNLRTGPGTQFTAVGDVRNGITLTAFQGTLKADEKGRQWIYVRTPARYGWLAFVSGLRLELAGTAPPVEAPPDANDYARALETITSTRKGILSVTLALNDLLDDLQSF